MSIRMNSIFPRETLPSSPVHSKGLVPSSHADWQNVALDWHWWIETPPS